MRLVSVVTSTRSPADPLADLAQQVVDLGGAGRTSMIGSIRPGRPHHLLDHLPLVRFS
jgi:hypothetical protein